MVRVAARIVGPADAEDIAQDAFIRAFHGLDGFRDDTAFRAWLLRITHNTALNHVAKRRPEPVAEPRDESVLVGVAGRRAAAGRRPGGTRAARAPGGQALLLLSPAHRAVLVLRDLEGLSYDEIATVTGSPLGSVKGRLHRARDELVAILRANTYDWELPR